MDDQIKQVVEEVNRLRQELAQQQAAADDARGRHTAELAAVRSQLNASGAQSQAADTVTNVPTVDRAGLNKIENFTGDQVKFKNWSFVFKAYMGASNSRYTDVFERIEASSVQLINATMTAEEREMSSKLYYVLTLTCKGGAMDKICNAGQGDRGMAAVHP